MIISGDDSLLATILPVMAQFPMTVRRADSNNDDTLHHVCRRTTFHGGLIMKLIELDPEAVRQQKNKQDINVSHDGLDSKIR
jgi:hypothetical protein